LRSPLSPPSADSVKDMDGRLEKLVKSVSTGATSELLREYCVQDGTASVPVSKDEP